MNIAVPADSPLGRYLAELDDDSSAISSAAALVSPRARGSPAGTKRDVQVQSQCDRSDQSNKSSAMARPWSSLLASAQTFATEQFLVKVSASNHFADLRESVLEIAALGSATPAAVRWWIPQAAASMGGTTTVAIAVVIGVVASHVSSLSIVSDISATSSLMSMACFALLVFSVLLVAVEVVYQLLLLRYSYATSCFEDELRVYSSVRTEFYMEFRLALDVVKRSELAARGYRLGRVLPPVGRLEEASSARDPNFELQFRRLRMLLRDINDSMERAGRAITSRSISCLQAGNTATQSTATNTPTDNRPAPSLLITSLAKRHELSSILLDTAQRDTLVEDLSSLLIGRTSGHGQSFLSSITAQVQAYRLLSQQMKIWTTDLSRWNMKHHRHFASPNTIDSPIKPAGSDLPSDVCAISRALHDLQASCETLSTLARTSQHNIEDEFSGDSTQVRETSEREVSATRSQRRMKQSLAQMRKLMQQLSSDWDSLEQAIQAAGYGGDLGSSHAATRDDDPVVDVASLHNQDQRRVAEIQEEQQDAERDFLLVYTATSTGEKDFDLQSLLRQQQQLVRDGSNALPVPSFMGELQDVLERRQALPSAPTLEKQIIDGAVAPVVQGVHAQSAPIPSPMPQAIDLQQLLHSRFTAQLVEESFGGDESDEREVDDEEGDVGKP